MYIDVADTEGISVQLEGIQEEDNYSKTVP